MTALGDPAELRDHSRAPKYTAFLPAAVKAFHEYARNPTAIGLFLIGAVALAVTGTAVLASTAWFDKQPFVSFFQESVNGLENGAPVKFRVPVGTVTDLGIQIDQRGKSFRVPVEYEIDLMRLTTRLGAHVNLADTTVLQRHIADGLRAALAMESSLPASSTSS
jgi:paraquat-inducible protein B